MRPDRARPRVDVGVVTWNSARLSVDALRRLVESDQGCELRVLVHDNASSDGTAAAIAEALPTVEVVSCPENLGFARAVNRLLARSDAPWFFMLNSDAWPEAGAIGTLVRRAEQNPRAAAVAPLLLRPDGSVEHSTHPFPSLATAALDAAGGRRWLPRPLLEHLSLEGAWHLDRERQIDWAVGAALLLRRSAVDDIGGLDERFFMYVEDLEWCWRARRAGWEVRFEPTAEVRHVGGVSGKRRFGDSRAALEAANLRVLLDDTLGRQRARWYRALVAVAGARQLVSARARGDAEEEAWWRLQVRATLGLVPPPVGLGRTLTEDVAGGEADGADAEGGIDGHGRPKVAVAVPTHNRATQLERLLAALEKQTLPAEEFEVLVVDDGSADDTGAVVARFRTATQLNLRSLRTEPRRGPAAARNRAWRTTAAPVVAFTDDDCVPDPEWLRAGLAAFEDEARIVVGRTKPPEEQLALSAQPFARVMDVGSPDLYETCNVFYRRRELEAVGGFDERFRRPSGEDTHLGLAVRDLGVEAVFAPNAVVLHDVRPGNLIASLRESLRWADIPLVVKGRPLARATLLHRWVFWKKTHPPAMAAALGLTVAVITRRPAPLVLLVPWVIHRLKTDPVCPDRLGRVVNLPGALALDLCEVATMVRGSVRHRTVLM
ncbi:MAG TPA: glycosyltransferase [Acidimicrobiales bacterium]|nr:glycosyltransferase [Acidimicrobiales bacterium]